MAAETDLAAYGQAFEAYVAAVQAKELALDMASWSVSSVANNLDVLQAGLADDGVYTLKQSQGQQGGEFLEQAAQVAQVSRLMLQAMDEARVRLEKKAARAKRRKPGAYRPDGGGRQPGWPVAGRGQ